MKEASTTRDIIAQLGREYKDLFIPLLWCEPESVDDDHPDLQTPRLLFDPEGGNFGDGNPDFPIGVARFPTQMTTEYMKLNTDGTSEPMFGFNAMGRGVKLAELLVRYFSFDIETALFVQYLSCDRCHEAIIAEMLDRVGTERQVIMDTLGLDEVPTLRFGDEEWERRGESEERCELCHPPKYIYAVYTGEVAGA